MVKTHSFDVLSTRKCENRDCPKHIKARLVASEAHGAKKHTHCFFHHNENLRRQNLKHRDLAKVAKHSAE